MEEFPEELRTPPVALSCLIGFPDVHPLITAQLHSQQPPINAIALPDFSNISIIPPKKPSRDTSDPPAGIIKRDWFSKHRTRIPAVVAAIFSSRDVSGDPAQWQQLCSDLDRLKYIPSNFYLTLCVIGAEFLCCFLRRASIRGRNIKLVVLVVTKWNDKGLWVFGRVGLLISSIVCMILIRIWMCWGYVCACRRNNDCSPKLYIWDIYCRNMALQWCWSYLRIFKFSNETL